VVLQWCIFYSTLRKIAESFGLKKERQKKLLSYHFAGTLKLKQTKQTATALQHAVATKGGTTEAIIESLDRKTFISKFQKFGDGYARIKKIKETL